MCLIGIRIDQDGSVLIAANRDEFADRPTLPMHWWDEGILAGKDLRAGGTWLGLTASGRFAAITNVRDPSIKNHPIPMQSRGLLAKEFLLQLIDAQDFLSQIQDRLKHPAAFNLIAGTLNGDDPRLFWLGGRVGEIKQLEIGTHTLSNAELNSPWPKAKALKDAMQDVVQAHHHQLWDAMSHKDPYPDQALPDTGVGIDWERRLSSPLITGSDYHTRSTALLSVHQNKVQIKEVTRGPSGDPVSEAQFSLTF